MSRKPLGYGYIHTLKSAPPWLSKWRVKMISPTSEVYSLPKFAIHEGMLCDARGIEVAITELNTLRAQMLVPWRMFKKEIVRWCGQGLPASLWGELILAPLDVAETGDVPEFQPSKEWLS